MSNLGVAKSSADSAIGRSSNLSPAVEDYLRALYKLGRRNLPDEPVTTSQVAACLAVRPASATAMLQKLAALEPPLVVYHKSHGARLTAAGERSALSIVRCHRLLELFLHEKLGYTWDEVHEEADRLEHAVSDEMAGRIAAALGHPTRDPHGQAIPAADLSLEYVAAVPLHSLPPGAAAVVRQVRDDDPAMLRLFAALGLRPGAPLVLLGTAPDGTLRLHVAGCDVELAAAAAEHLLVIIDES